MAEDLHRADEHRFVFLTDAADVLAWQASRARAKDVDAEAEGGAQELQFLGAQRGRAVSCPDPVEGSALFVRSTCLMSMRAALEPMSMAARLNLSEDCSGFMVYVFLLLRKKGRSIKGMLTKGLHTKGNP